MTTEEWQDRLDEVEAAYRRWRRRKELRTIGLLLAIWGVLISLTAAFLAAGL